MCVAVCTEFVAAMQSVALAIATLVSLVPHSAGLG